MFGPLGLVVRVGDEAQILEVAQSLQGQLTCTLHLDAGDTVLGQKLLPVLGESAR